MHSHERLPWVAVPAVSARHALTDGPRLGTENTQQKLWLIALAAAIEWIYPSVRNMSREGNRD
jgi:hypothetical protein